MEYVKIMIAVVWLISLADVLGLGVGAVQSAKKTYVPKSGTYYKAVGIVNILVGVIATLLIQMFIVDSWAGPGWMITVALVGGFINIVVGMISAVIGVMMYP